MSPRHRLAKWAGPHSRRFFTRQHDDSGVSALTPALRSSLRALRSILESITPRRIPLGIPLQHALVYADAFFRMGDTIHSAETWHSLRDFDPVNAHLYVNGFGFVIFPPGGKRPVYVHGTIPASFLAKFADKGQYIFWRETFAQCAALWVFPHLLHGPVMAFDDNTASEHALTRGYSSDPSTNAIVSHFWGAATAAGASVWLERVSSAANIADAISRGDFTHAIAEGWHRATVDFSNLWPVLLEITRPPYDFSPLALSKIMAAVKIV